jgi:hypothetical protein
MQVDVFISETNNGLPPPLALIPIPHCPVPPLPARYGALFSSVDAGQTRCTWHPAHHLPSACDENGFYA